MEEDGAWSFARSSTRWGPSRRRNEVEDGRGGSFQASKSW